jgi:hypothetical protein
MAVKSAVVNRSPQGQQAVVTAQWVMANSDTSVPVELTDYADRSVQVTGTFGGATITLEGSNDGTNYVTLRDPQGVALSFTAAGLKQVMETTLYVRASITGGAGSTLTVTLCMRKSDPRSWS